MLPRSKVLRSPEVERLIKEGRSASSGFLRAKYLSGMRTGARFAFVVGKKVAGDAVTRNRLRRWASVAAQALKVEEPYDIVVLVGKKYAKSELLVADLAALVRKIVQTAHAT